LDSKPQVSAVFQGYKAYSEKCEIHRDDTYIHALLCKSQSLPNVFRASEAFLFNEAKANKKTSLLLQNQIFFLFLLKKHD